LFGGFAQEKIGNERTGVSMVRFVRYDGYGALPVKLPDALHRAYACGRIAHYNIVHLLTLFPQKQ
jgi:hypothetical protein